MAKNDGGSAFPKPAHGEPGYYSYVSGQPGMTLRDWFAGHAPELPYDFGHTVRPDLDNYRDRFEEYERDMAQWLTDRLALWAYAYADAMLAAREKDA